MSPEEHIAERIRATNRERMARKDVKLEKVMLPKVEYYEIKLPHNVISKTTINGTVETTKQLKSREKMMVSPEPEEGIKKNGIKIAERPKNVTIGKMKSENGHITKMLNLRVPIIYYVIMLFGVASAIFGAFTAISPPVDYSIILGGIGIFLMAFIGVLEIESAKRKFKMS